MAGEKKKEEKKGSPGKGLSGKLGVILFIIIIIVVIAGALVYGLVRSPQSQTSISVFESNFDSAPRVAVVMTAYNSLQLAISTACATGLIEQLTATHGSAHKNASDISLYAINSTSCVYAPSLGTASSGYSNSTPEGCVNMSKKIPSIFINYSNTNTTVITPDALYVSGTGQFLSECAVASEITAT